MNLKVTLLFFILNVNSILCQENRIPESFGFSDDVTTEYDAPRSFINYFSEFSIDNNWFLRFEKQQTTLYSLTGSYSNLEYPFLTKYYMSDKFSILFGPQINIFLKDFDIENVSSSFTFGAQYNVNRKFSIEGRINNIMTKKIYNSNYNFGKGVNYKLGTRLKF
jgi:hypothetical protein